jgi:hypothetical protein
MIGGAGWSFPSQKSLWRTSFAAYLSSFKFEFIFRVTSALKNVYPDVIFLHPFHDVFLIAIPTKKKDLFDQSLKIICEEVSREMKFHIVLKMEIKFYESNNSVV